MSTESELRRHDRLYHDEQNPEITDAEYDELKRRAGATASPGYPPSQQFAPVPHPEPMLSLANAFNQDEFRTWHARTIRALDLPAFPMTAELKIDGIAVRMEYRQGALTLAATRGDGATGENVTATVSRTDGLPQRLNPPDANLDLRGEIYLPIPRFNDLNEEREAEGLTPYANPRNAAAGAVRQLDPREAAKRGLKLWAYSLNHTPGQTRPSSHTQSLQELQRRGFPVNPQTITTNHPDEIIHYFQSMLEQRHRLDYHADGIVIKADLQQHRDVLGATSHEPRWAIAWKFPAERRATTLKDIQISIGRFGKLTPVAVLEPVTVGGVTVQSASLHNEDYIQTRNLRPGQTVIIERAGDVIPQVLGPAEPDDNHQYPPFQMPTHCPACRQPAVRPEGDAAHWCRNDECPSRLPETLKHFVSKNAMNIDGLGEKWCRALIDNGMVQNPADLYSITRPQLLTLDRMGSRLADRILANIEASKQQPLHRVLYSLGIFRLGRTVSRILADRYGDIDAISHLDEDELAAIDGIGPIIARSVNAGLRTPRVRQTLDQMRRAGVDMQTEIFRNDTPTTAAGDRPWTGLNFVVTGKLGGMTRPQAERAIQELGGAAAGSVTKITDYLVCGEKPGSKLAKARQLDVNIVTEAEFLNALNRPQTLTQKTKGD